MVGGLVGAPVSALPRSTRSRLHRCVTTHHRTQRKGPLPYSVGTLLTDLHHILPLLACPAHPRQLPTTARPCLNWGFRLQSPRLPSAAKNWIPPQLLPDHHRDLTSDSVFFPQNKHLQPNPKTLPRYSYLLLLSSQSLSSLFDCNCHYSLSLYQQT